MRTFGCGVWLFAAACCCGAASFVGAADADDSDANKAAADTDGGDSGAAVATADDEKKAPAPGPVSAGSDADIWWVMLSKGHECSTDDVDIDDAETVEECAMRCAVFEGCQYFIFGHGDKKHKCWYVCVQSNKERETERERQTDLSLIHI